MERKKIPVIWGADKKYVLQAFVVMRSILLHSREEYHFFILTADDIKKEAEEYVKILKKEFSHISVSIRMIEDDSYKTAQIYNKHLSAAAYFRLFISELVPEYDTCIYLDCDIIVHGDLAELYKVDLESNYIAGVKDCHIINKRLRPARHQEILGLSDFGRYINSGVIVMNLKKMRNDNCIERFCNQLKKENLYEDQDILNICCYPMIKILPLKYNLFHFYLGKHIKFLYALPYEKQDFNFDHENPFILHMGASYKPWNSFEVRGSEEWWQIAEVFCASKSYQYYLKKCRETETKNEIMEILQKAKESSKIVIWGGGKNGRRLCDILFEYGIENVVAVADNNENLWGGKYRGIEVCAPDKLMKNSKGIFWIVACRVNYSEVFMQLKENGIKEENIIHYNNYYEDFMYLLSLKESAYDKEVDKLADLEYVKFIPTRERRKKYIQDIVQNPLCYTEQYAYLEKKYNFKYWIGTVGENDDRR